MGNLVRKVKSIDEYIKFIYDTNGFSASNIVVEHRHNNAKRDYLFVNKKQCKHIPARPKEMYDMCTLLSAEIYKGLNKYNGKYSGKLLVVAFAETATAIGNIVADQLNDCICVMQTTREDVSGSVDIISFEEEHSHATTQKLVSYSTDFIKNMDIRYVLFIDDEITTGKTILNFIDKFRAVKPDLKYGVASICNWMNGDSIREFQSRDIDRFALIYGEIKDINKRLDDYNGLSVKGTDYTQPILIDRYNVTSGETFRSERLGHERNRNLDSIYDEVKNIIDGYKNIKSIRIIGTEEFMYIPIMVGLQLEREGLDVICQASTRSNIDVIDDISTGCADAIKTNYNIVSLYDSERENHIYNLEERTDIVLIITDGTTNSDAIGEFVKVIRDSHCSSNIEVVNL